MTIEATSLASLPRMIFAIIIFFGLILVFIVPPIQGPDEDSHFLRAIMLVEGSIYPTYENGRWGQSVPQSLRDYIAAHSYLRADSDKKYTYQRWYRDSHAPVSTEPRVHISYSSQLASPLLYLPQIAGILVGKIFYRAVPAFPFNWPAALYFARLGNLLVFATGMALALRFLPFLRHTVAFIALMPMSVFLASTVSYDVTVNLAAIAFLTLVIATWHSGIPPSLAAKRGILIAAFMLGHAKAVYLPLILIIALLRHAMPRQDFAILTGIGLAAGITGAVSALVLFGFTGVTTQATFVEAQNAFLFSHPLAVPALIWNSLIEHSGFYIISFFGNFGWLDTNLPLPAIMLLLALLFAAVVVDGLQPRAISLQWLDRTVVFVGCLASVTLTMLALYIIWTSHQAGGVGAQLVDGVQGRYFIPIAPYFFSLLLIVPTAAGRRLNWVRTTFPQLQLIAAAAMLGLTCFSVLARFWIPNQP